MEIGCQDKKMDTWAENSLAEFKDVLNETKSMGMIQPMGWEQVKRIQGPIHPAYFSYY